MALNQKHLIGHEMLLLWPRQRLSFDEAWKQKVFRSVSEIWYTNRLITISINRLKLTRDDVFVLQFSKYPNDVKSGLIQGFLLII